MDHPPTAVTLPSDRQRRALHAGFTQLGYRSRSDRAERLALAAETLGLPQLESFNDLTRGQTGYLLGRLRRGDLLQGEAPYSEPELAQVHPAQTGGTCLPKLAQPEPVTSGPAVPGQQQPRQAMSDRIAAAASIAAIATVISLGIRQIRQHLAQKPALLSGSSAT